MISVGNGLHINRVAVRICPINIHASVCIICVSLKGLSRKLKIDIINLIGFVILHIERIAFVTLEPHLRCQLAAGFFCLSGLLPVKIYTVKEDDLAVHIADAVDRKSVRIHIVLD